MRADPKIKLVGFSDALVPHPFSHRSRISTGLPRRNNRAFTLLEVILAVIIAVGMMAVVLYFYSQAARLRNDVLKETSRINTARMILERLTAELRTALPASTLNSGLTGTSNELQFVRLEAPIVSPLTMDTNLPASIPPVTLKTIHYVFSAPEDETNNASLTRTETPVGAGPVAVAVATNEVVETTNEVEAATATNSAPKGLELTRDLGFVLFRYWNGTEWQDYWDSPSLPLGIQISLGNEPLPSELPPEEYPFDLYRRTIYLPMGDRNFSTSTSAAPSDQGMEESVPNEESGDF